MDNLMKIVGLVCVILALLFHTIGCFAPYWQSLDISGNVSYSYGLWMFCASNPGTTTCLSISLGGLGSFANAWRAAQFFEIVAFLALIVTLVISICHMFVNAMKKKMIVIILVILCFVIVAFVILGVIIYGAECVIMTYSASWALALSVVGAVFALVAGIMYTVAMAQDKSVA